MSHKIKIADLVGTIVEEADDSLKQKLSQAIEDFAEDTPLGFKDVRKGVFANALFDALIEAADARIDPATLHPEM